jgi:hypothetical protein
MRPTTRQGSSSEVCGQPATDSDGDRQPKSRNINGDIIDDLVHEEMFSASSNNFRSRSSLMWRLLHNIDISGVTSRTGCQTWGRAKTASFAKAKLEITHFKVMYQCFYRQIKSLLSEAQTPYLRLALKITTGIVYDSTI